MLTTQISTQADNELFKDCAAAMLVKINEYRPHLFTDFAKFAVILDPRLKNTYFSQEGNEVPLMIFRSYFERHYSNMSQSSSAPTDEHRNESEINPPKTLFSAIYKLLLSKMKWRSIWPYPLRQKMFCLGGQIKNINYHV